MPARLPRLRSLPTLALGPPTQNHHHRPLPNHIAPPPQNPFKADSGQPAPVGGGLARVRSHLTPQPNHSTAPVTRARPKPPIMQADTDRTPTREHE